MTTNGTATVVDASGNSRQVDARTALQVFGKRGLSIWGGFVREEYLPDIADWPRQAKLFLEMRDDPTVGGLLDAIKLPLLSSLVMVEPASDSSADVQAAAWLDKAMQSMHRQTWRAYMDDALEALDFGWAVNEIVLEKRRDGNLWIRNIEPRGQETLRRWVVEDDEAVGMIQGPFRGSEVVDSETIIPLEKCVHIAYRGRKGNPQGRSLQRSMYQPYKFLKNLRIFEGIGIERDVGGTPVLTLPEGLNTITGSEFDDLRDQLDGLKMDETLWVTVPAGASLTPFAGGSKMYNVRETIRDYEKLIHQRFFAQFLDLGMDSAGTQALVKGSQDFFSLALEGIQSILVEAWNQQLVPYLFRFNRFPGTTGLPEIVWATPGKDDVSALVDLYQRGVTARLITPTREDEVQIRDIADLPELPEGEGEGSREPPAPQSPFGPVMPRMEQPAQQQRDVQDTALNGAQVASMLEIVTAVSNKTLPPAAAMSLLQAAFPKLDPSAIKAMIADAQAFQPPAGKEAGETPAESAMRAMRRHFVIAESPAGQDLRTIPGIYEQFANDYQRDLVDLYDGWSRETARLASLPDRGLDDLRAQMNGRLNQLSIDLKTLGRQRIGDAAGLGLKGPLGKHAQTAGVQQVVTQLIEQNVQYVDDVLIPSIRDRVFEDLPDIARLPERTRRAALIDTFATRRARLAQGAGVAIQATYESQRVAGTQENRERTLRGETPIPVKWVLDERAEHCADDAARGTFGCPNLARVYDDGWLSLPTVPAGAVSCLGNCRCQIFADFLGNGTWERIT